MIVDIFGLITTKFKHHSHMRSTIRSSWAYHDTITGLFTYVTSNTIAFQMACCTLRFHRHQTRWTSGHELQICVQPGSESRHHGFSNLEAVTSDYV